MTQQATHPAIIGVWGPPERAHQTVYNTEYDAYQSQLERG